MNFSLNKVLDNCFSSSVTSPFESNIYMWLMWNDYFITYQLSFIHSVEADVTFLLKKCQNPNCNGNEKL